MNPVITHIPSDLRATIKREDAVNADTAFLTSYSFSVTPDISIKSIAVPEIKEISKEYSLLYPLSKTATAADTTHIPRI